MLSIRRIALSGFLICLGVVVSSILLGYWKHLESCLLCNTERVIFVLVGIALLIASFKKKTNNYFLGFFAIVFSLFGIIVSGWQVYLQHKPAEEGGMCLPAGSMMDSVRDLIHGTSGECAQIVWKFFGFSMASWALAIFIILFFVSGLYFSVSKSRGAAY